MKLICINNHIWHSEFTARICPVCGFPAIEGVLS